MARKARSYRAEYQARLARAKGLSPRAATHRAGGTVPAFLQGQDQIRQVQVSYRESKRVGRYDNLVRQLTAGQITAKEFDRTVKRWQPLTTTDGRKHQWADAATALYQAEAARDLSQREYERTMFFDIQGS